MIDKIELSFPRRLSRTDWQVPHTLIEEAQPDCFQLLLVQRLKLKCQAGDLALWIKGPEKCVLKRGVLILIRHTWYACAIRGDRD
jgi:hypothetical protein